MPPRKSLPIIAAAILAAACGAPMDTPVPENVRLAVVEHDAHHLALREGARTVALLPVEHVNLDRAEAVRGDDGDVAVSWHHGRFGGSTLLLARHGEREFHELLTTRDDQSLSAPRFAADGRLLVAL
ncbi:MAG: hypothetical protein KC503_46310, partial [Myxococcales bacterium]|nr:hypothetical protein [Myxococcales bacterium]